MASTPSKVSLCQPLNPFNSRSLSDMENVACMADSSGRSQARRVVWGEWPLSLQGGRRALQGLRSSFFGAARRRRVHAEVLQRVVSQLRLSSVPKTTFAVQPHSGKGGVRRGHQCGRVVEDVYLGMEAAQTTCDRNPVFCKSAERIQIGSSEAKSRRSVRVTSVRDTSLGHHVRQLDDSVA